MKSTQFSHDKKDLIKIGKTWFKPQIHSYLKLYQYLQSYIKSDDILWKKDGRSLFHGTRQHISQQKMQQIFELIVETQVQTCQQIILQKLLHIKFNNLKHLCLEKIRLDNIEALQFMDLSQLQTLYFHSGITFQPEKKLLQLRTIHPLIKSQMPKIKTLIFKCGSLKSMGRDISRIKTSRYLDQLVLERNQFDCFWPEQLNDEDMRIWSKAEAKDIELIGRWNQEYYTTVRIAQNSVENCLKRKYKSLE